MAGSNVPQSGDIAPSATDAAEHPVLDATPSVDVLADYWFALIHVGGVFCLEEEHYVLQDWDSKGECLQIGTYRHVIRLQHAPLQAGVACTCPRWKAHGTCVHSDLIFTHWPDFVAFPAIAPSPIPSAVYLCETPFVDTHLFSCVSSVGLYGSGKRVIVSYQRDGRWHCESCLPLDLAERPHQTEQEDADTEGSLLMRVGGRDDRKHGSISHIRVLPPRWCALPEEALPPSPSPPVTGAHFRLDALSRCACGVSIQTLPGLEIRSGQTREAILYGLAVRSPVSIEVLPCTICHHRRRYIGPDLGDLGVFNWNNTFLFTHELLNAYTNAFTASETPFAAFCLTIRRQYEDRCPGLPFCSDETFVRAWFSFVELQDLDSGFQCPTCGPSPTVVIADGVSLATHASKLKGADIKPPTFTDSSSERIESISSYKARQLPAIHDRSIRREVLEFLSVTSTPAISNTVPNISAIEGSYPELAKLLHLTIMEEMTAVGSQHKRKALRDLIRQIAAPDIVLQLVPHDVFEALTHLGATGVAESWLQALCPAVGTVVRIYKAESAEIPMEVRAVAVWLVSRAQDVYARLHQHSPAAPMVGPGPHLQNPPVQIGAM
ncbi:hypothetical protein C2E23DRAFT_882019 [Lenzites betulinus]|nr:hypothetical protein C2E23DRAFT_882019 [Lenzites betulinus]